MTGTLPVDRKLPSMQKLAAWYGVSIPTMQAAIHILRAIGFVRVMPGVGTFVSRPRTHGAALNHAWIRASAHELALMRFAIDVRVPLVVARRIETAEDERMPATVAALPFLAMERSMTRHAWPESYIEADVAFHAAMARALPGAELTAGLYRALTERLMPSLVASADVQRNLELSDLHRELAEAVRDGGTLRAGRLARAVAGRELAALHRALG